jgi:F0F1-type ATP synthase delta subunit|tara:strand:+ start:394 stop:618 length:225 start_codon:yes stop_codon:yes gene_type:complete
MDFIESLLLIDTLVYLDELSKELNLSPEKKKELIDSVVKKNHFIGKKVKNRYLHLMSSHRSCVTIEEIKSRLNL